MPNAPSVKYNGFIYANEEDCEIAKYEMHEAYNSKPTEYKLATTMNSYCVEFESFPIQGLMNKIDLGV
tara:strand:+ start:67 stop:270 length:204 start_codon:yes stop_codon:yes gene_type:complete